MIPGDVAFDGIAELWLDDKAALAQMATTDEFAAAKVAGRAYQMTAAYEDIDVPKNTPVGFLLCVLSGVWMFALVWWIWWVVAVTTVAIILTVILWSFALDNERTIPAETVRRDHEKWLDLVRKSTAVGREQEYDPENLGHAKTELGA